MIKPDAKLSVQCISLGKLILDEFEVRYIDRLLHYVKLLQEHPDEYVGFLSVVPSDTYPGLYVILDGHHKYAASIMTGRKDILAVVIEEAAH
jgi:hypothetical protein